MASDMLSERTVCSGPTEDEVPEKVDEPRADDGTKAAAADELPGDNIVADVYGVPDDTRTVDA